MVSRKDELRTQIEELKRARAIAGMNRTEFSIYMGIPRRTLEEWEGGRRKAPDYVIRLISQNIVMEQTLKRHGINQMEGLDEDE